MFFRFISKSPHSLFKILVLLLLSVVPDVKLDKCNEFRIENFSTLPLSTKLEGD